MRKFDYRFGWGTVIENDPTKKYGIKVLFDCGEVNEYDQNGCDYENGKGLLKDYEYTLCEK